MTSTDRQPTEFGWFLLRAIAAAGFTRHAHVARAAEIGGATLSRLIYGGVDQPKVEVLDRLADALGVDRAEMRTQGGYSMPRDGRRLHPRALELDQMLGEGTPLSPEEQRYLDDMTDRLMAPYRGRIRRLGA